MFRRRPLPVVRRVRRRRLLLAGGLVGGLVAYRNRRITAAERSMTAPPTA